MSDSTIIVTSSSKATVGSQPSCSRRLLGSAQSRSTSAGRMKRRSATTWSLPVQARGGEGPLDAVHGRCASRRCRSRSPRARPGGASGACRGRSRRRSPSRGGPQVAQAELPLQAELDPGDAEDDLAGDELGAPARRLVVEQDSRRPRTCRRTRGSSGSGSGRRPWPRRTGCAGGRGCARSAGTRGPCRTSPTTRPGRSGSARCPGCGTR